MQAAQGDSAAALKSYQAGLDIAERLAAGDSRNAQWQRDVAVSWWNLASLGGALGSLQDQQAKLQKGLQILTTQRDRGPLPARDVYLIKVFENSMQKLS